MFNSLESLLNPFFAYSEYPKIQFRVPNPSLSKKLFRFLKHNTVGYRFEISAIKIVCMSVVTWFWISNFEADIKNSRIVLFSDFSLLWQGLECTVKNVLYFSVNSVNFLKRYQQRRTWGKRGFDWILPLFELYCFHCGGDWSNEYSWALCLKVRKLLCYEWDNADFPNSTTAKISNMISYFATNVNGETDFKWNMAQFKGSCM